MLKLNETESYAQFPTLRGKLQGALTDLQLNRGVIKPQHIAADLLNLHMYIKKKSSSATLLMNALTLYEQLGRIQLFDFGTASSGSSDVPAQVPLIPGKASATSTAGQTTPGCIYMNMWRMGMWAPDDSTYDDLEELTDLAACLESGYVSYVLLIEQRADSVLKNAGVLENLTRIYTKLFYDALMHVSGGVHPFDFQQDCTRFVIAKFFMIHLVQMNDDDTVNKYAQRIAQSHVSLSALTQYEDNVGINYESLSGFLATLGNALNNGNPIGFGEFSQVWALQYGDGTAMAIEYIPYLLHYLIAVRHASRMGGSCARLIRSTAKLEAEGASKLYSALVLAVTK